MARMSAAPPPASTDWREEIAPDEDDRFTRHAETLREIQRANDQRSGKGRGLHRKGHVGVEGSFEVVDGLPEELRVGLAATPTKYRALVRFSNGGPVHQGDGKPDIRGIAVKLLGVPGKKIIAGMEDAVTQDLLAIHMAYGPFRGPDEFVGFVQAARSPALALPRLIARFGFGGAFRMLREFLKGVGKPPPTLATMTFFSGLPLRWGDHAAKFVLQPVPGASDAGGEAKGDDRLRADLGARLARAELQWDFCVQLYRDAERTPIEDARVEWKQDVAPLVKVARLTLPVQDVTSARGVALTKWLEQLSFDPWHALEEHRPLGALMRARNQAYRLSTLERGAAGEPAVDGQPPGA